MIYLKKHTASNDIYLTLFEWKQDLAFTNYLFKLVHQTSFKEYFFVANVLVDNDRYTKINVATNLDAVDSILLEESGYLYYYVYGQNSDSNLDPALAVGEIERGIVSVPSDENYFTNNAQAINDTVYYG